eukprot:SAG31_NODE_511_length_14722_cov_14.770499_9_plen_55_part_00
MAYTFVRFPRRHMASLQPVSACHGHITAPMLTARLEAVRSAAAALTIVAVAKPK